ncbi:hypothetical protein [Sphingobium ummariense]|uniref:Uncharacterized protein n=1 Tax=Sphingobium ummariense RL-3 TaxID=1346791 RepID=T0J611_9SPHN|nr:hypothetical protein [Sphingobium ummariense]EQB32252.1 hypothetical protein M529_10645 [Sphingobium ummariense RL-3]
MEQFNLSSAEWTLIVPPDGARDVDIRPLVGSCLTSLHIPHERGAATLTMPPVPVQDWVWTGREVMAGIAVYAKGIGGPAVVTVAALAR